MNSKDQTKVEFSNIYKSETASTRIALVGDSITELTAYPDYLAKMLGDTFVVYNFGVCGSTVVHNSYNPYIHTLAFQRVLEFQPNIILVMLGTNDACLESLPYLGYFENDYTLLLGKFQSLQTKPQIWLVKPPHIFGETLGYSNKVLEKEIIPAIERVVCKIGLPLIDAYSALDNLGFFLDGVHPNDLGARTIAQTVYRKLSGKES